MIDTVLFDLDSTLLCMDQDEFVKVYFGRLCAYMSRYGWEAQSLGKVIWGCVAAMIKNQEDVRNDIVFWQQFETLTGRKKEDVEDGFQEFYEKDFPNVRVVAQKMEQSAAIIRVLKEKGYRLALATNPLFPQIATYSRVEWAGMDPADFEWITTYENSNYCKPSPKYYQEVLAKLGADPAQCLMVGNDVDEDMCAADLGLQVHLITDYLLDRHQKGIDGYPHSTLTEFLEIAKEMPVVK